MRFPDVYNKILEVAGRQLFARCPENYTELFKERLFYNNIPRFSIQSTILVFMDMGTLLLYLISLGGREISYAYIATLIIKIAAMAVSSYTFARMRGRPFRPGTFFHRRIDVIYPAFHAVSEAILFLAGPKDAGSFIRLAAGPFIVGSIPIINQGKAMALLGCEYIFFTLWIYNSSNPGVFGAYTFYSLWFVVYACSIFLSFTIYSWCVNNFTASMEAEQAGSELSLANERLEQEVRQRAKLLRAVNEISEGLLGSDTDDFDMSIVHAMGIIGTTMEVDRVYIWKNDNEGDDLYCTQIYEWSGGAEPQQGNDLTISVPFPSDWYPKLSKNLCVNGIVREFPKYEREHLEAQGIISLVVVPVFLHDEFWGFVGFDDCRNERSFTDIEEAILRTVGLLFTTSVMRNEMTTHLVQVTEEALASSRAKTDFLSNMSHEIRTPINAITGMSAIARGAEDRAEVEHCLDRIDAASRQLLSIINDVLDMSKIEAGKIELNDDAFTLQEVLRNVRSIVGVQASEKKLEFAADFDPALPEVVVGDDMRLSQILINLLSNAVKFTPEHGKIFFGARKLQSLDDGFDEIEFVVEDTGIGIPEGQQQSLFIKFEQADRGISRKFGGTGLGLAISKSIAELMRGDIEVESAYGEGSRFTVRVCLKRGTQNMLRSGIAGSLHSIIDFSGLRALLVEDIEINREIVIAMLESTGLEIDEAEDGKAAIDTITADPDRYDLIFMDLHMPVMDGYTATQEIRSMEHAGARSVPIIAMTANAFSEDIQRCRDIGMNDHVSKPIDFDELIVKIGRAAGREA